MGLSSRPLALGRNPATNTDGWTKSSEDFQFFHYDIQIIKSQIFLSSIIPELLTADFVKLS